jgi:hypothetical protein
VRTLTDGLRRLRKLVCDVRAARKRGGRLHLRLSAFCFLLLPEASLKDFVARVERSETRERRMKSALSFPCSGRREQQSPDRWERERSFHNSQRESKSAMRERMNIPVILRWPRCGPRRMRPRRPGRRPSRLAALAPQGDGSMPIPPRKPRVTRDEYATRFKAERARQQQRYCDAFGLWRQCTNRRCRRECGCRGDAYACLSARSPPCRTTPNGRRGKTCWRGFRKTSARPNARRANACLSIFTAKALRR